ncbi:Mitochondrial ribosomal protein L51 / S25 / CI-B8 domain-containing protein [Elsinoe fawcettii]|nr:Mitochondrial ribosomal protein L51 / S25 / CI-B8 domain-containing protein [Elsinoe fawcettii]
MLMKSQKLLAMRLGPGALKLPKDVSRIHLRFAQKMHNGHMGPRKFWRHELVRLKYHNPAVAMTIDHNAPNEEEPLMTVFFAPKDAIKTSGSSTGGAAPTTSTSGDKVASDSTPTDRAESITMAWKKEEEILDDLIRVTKATTVQPTAEERAQLRQLAEDASRSKVDSERSLAVVAERKRQEAILKEARGEAATN